MKSSKPKISFVIATKNRAKVLPISLRSLQAQTEPNWEAVVVDDQSTDQTEAVVNSFADERIRYYKLPANRGTGIATARNFGNVLARAKLIAVQDDEDISLPDRAERAITSHRQQGWDFYSARREIDGDISKIALTKPQPLPNKWDPDLFKTFSYVVHISVVYTKSAVLEVPYNSAYPLAVDYDLISRFMALGKKIYYDPVITCIHRVNPNGISHQTSRDFRVNLLKAIRGFRGWNDEPFDVEKLAE